MEGLKLNEAEEKAFQTWIRKTDWFKEFVNDYNEEPDLNIEDYDYRLAWKSGVKPEPDPFDKDKYHWPSTTEDDMPLKSEKHPTVWKEYFMRETGKNPDALGITSKEEAENKLGISLTPRSMKRPLLMNNKLEE